jgi:hypothetical protein
MTNKEKVSGVGARSSRTDQNISERVAKVQREAKIQNATGGTYSQATQLQNLASGASTEMPSSVISPARTNTIATNVDTSFLNTVNPNPVTITDGAPGNTAGRQPEDLPAPVDAPDNNALIARAMFMMDPTPQNRRLLESFQQEGR